MVLGLKLISSMIGTSIYYGVSTRPWRTLSSSSNQPRSIALGEKFKVWDLNRRDVYSGLIMTSLCLSRWLNNSFINSTPKVWNSTEDVHGKNRWTSWCFCHLTIRRRNKLPRTHDKNPSADKYMKKEPVQNFESYVIEGAFRL